MLSNYLKIALRNFWKHKLFSFINIFGLSAGMMVCLLALVLVKDAFDYDKFHPYPNRTYRVLTDVTMKDGGKEVVATSPLPLGAVLESQYGFVEKTARIYYGLSNEVTTDAKSFSVNGAFADGSFFDLFGFRFISGQPAVAPRTVVISDRTAERFFGAASPLGKVLTLKNQGMFTITGVLDTKTNKSHLKFDLLASMATVSALEQSQKLSPQLNSWRSHWDASSYTYVLLREDTPRRALDGALASLSKLGTQALGPQTDQTYSLRSQVLSSLSPAREQLSKSTWEPTWGSVLGPASLALVILLLAGFNYVNLTIARSLSRAREVGVRKVAGAQRKQIVGQFLTESVMLAIFALGLAYIFKATLSPIRRMTEGIEFDPTLWAYFLGFALLTGILAGIAPARILSSYQPANVLRGRFGESLFRGMGLRKGLMVVQFVVSLVFMVFVTVMYQQFRHMATASYGFDRDNSLNIPVSPQNYRPVADKMSQLADVERVGATLQPLGFHARYLKVSPDQFQNYIPTDAHFTDANYVLNMDLKLIAGRNLPLSVSDSAGRFVLINEKAVTALRFKSPQEAVGQLLWLSDSSEVQVAGVLQDFNYQNLARPLNPLLLQYRPDEFHYLNVKVNPRRKAAVVAELEKAWQELYPREPFTYEWTDEALYNHHLHLDDLSVIGLLVAIALSIACLGLLGMVSYTTEMRTKEVGIRKVMGATVAQIVLLLSSGFVRLLLIAGVIALPLGYLAGELFLHEFAHRITLGVLGPLACFVVMLLVGGLTVGWLTFRAANEDPAKSLRTE
ncbi:ABC transporter permease [Persicitalea sp.]|uniref:ABC transporter permease n=1 Tax=Persicitalea sp. TaxID=3100273 RepID=UPI0035948E5D